MVQKKTIRICHLYPDLLNLYGDRGNILSMVRRLQWRGIDTQVTEVPVGEPFRCQDHDIFFIGGGQDFEQEVLLKDIASGKGEAIQHAIAENRVVLAICGGYQLLGEYYETWDGKRMDFLGALPFYTKGAKERMIGNYLFTTKNGLQIVGFENHSGRTYLKQGLAPLGKVIKGYGNNGEDGTEGVRYKNVYGTYSHGSLLPKNPRLCDELLQTALSARYPGETLTPLDDTLENEAHQYMVERLLKD